MVVLAKAWLTAVCTAGLMLLLLLLQDPLCEPHL
jgi:hypothetical protein